jgi:hypothetical protein
MGHVPFGPTIRPSVLFGSVTDVPSVPLQVKDNATRCPSSATTTSCSYGLTITGICLILVAQRLVPQERKEVREVMALAVQEEESGLRLKAADDT